MTTLFAPAKKMATVSQMTSCPKPRSVIKLGTNNYIYFLTLRPELDSYGF
jgi:hypothetical protein